MKRREIRETAFILVFESLFRTDSPDEIIAIAEEIDDIKVAPDAAAEFKGIIEHSGDLDDIISRFSEKRQIERIPKVNLAILKIALYEILYCDKIPMNVAINEAVLLSKKFSLEADVSFVNGVLGAYSRSEEAKS